MTAGARVLITGSAGFVGFHVARRLLADGARVLGVDDFNPYYEAALKEARNARLQAHPGFALARLDIADRAAFAAAWEGFKPDVVIHLAAQAGVRYSVERPEAYVSSNLVGAFNMFELARAQPPRHLLMASTSSLYGANEDPPFLETDRAAEPLTLYAATKGAGELMGHAYAHLFQIPMTFFRFFTVYGPWGRPDMAYFKFTDAILDGRPIEVFNHGELTRDFTFIDDLVEAVVRLIGVVPSPPAVEGDSLSPVAPFRIVNIGQGRPVGLMDFIGALETAIGRSALKTFLPMQPGDVTFTEASNALLRRLTGYAPDTPITVGAPTFVAWFREYYRR